MTDHPATTIPPALLRHVAAACATARDWARPAGAPTGSGYATAALDAVLAYAANHRDEVDYLLDQALPREPLTEEPLLLGTVVESDLATFVRIAEGRPGVEAAAWLPIEEHGPGTAWTWLRLSGADDVHLVRLGAPLQGARTGHRTPAGSGEGEAQDAGYRTETSTGAASVPRAPVEPPRPPWDRAEQYDADQAHALAIDARTVPVNEEPLEYASVVRADVHTEALSVVNCWFIRISEGRPGEDAPDWYEPDPGEGRLWRWSDLRDPGLVHRGIPLEETAGAGAENPPAPVGEPAHLWAYACVSGGRGELDEDPRHDFTAGLDAMRRNAEEREADDDGGSVLLRAAIHLGRWEYA